MSLLHACILGIIQGLTEFLPVSSSAHLILIPRFMGWPDQGLAFDVALHLGTLAALVIYFWTDLWELVLSFTRKQADQQTNRRLSIYLVLATIPAAVAGLILEKKIEHLFRSPILVAATLAGAGLLLWAADRFCSGQKQSRQINLTEALLIGSAQALALVPGVSRSGITMTAALALGLSRPEAARFSFLLAIPITAGAGLSKLPEILSNPDWAGFFIGFGTAAFSGWLAIEALLRWVQKSRYTPFVIYRLGLALLIVVLVHNGLLH